MKEEQNKQQQPSPEKYETEMQNARRGQLAKPYTYRVTIPSGMTSTPAAVIPGLTRNPGPQSTAAMEGVAVETVP